MRISVADNPRASRFEVTVDDEPAGHLEYVLADGVYSLPHTWTEPKYRGKGVATQLVRWALEEIDSRGAEVVPQCPFVQTVIDEHPEYRELVNADSPSAFCVWRPPA